MGKPQDKGRIIQTLPMGSDTTLGPYNIEIPDAERKIDRKQIPKLQVR